MKFKCYSDIDEYKSVVLDLLLEDEVINNLPLSILIDSKKIDGVNHLLATVTNDIGDICLVAICTKPFNILLYEPVLNTTESNGKNDAMDLLASELKRLKFDPPGVLAVSGLARRFADAYCGVNGGRLAMSMVLMRLDKIGEYKKASGFCRTLCEDDLSFTPSWEQAFCVDCRLPVFSKSDNEERIRTRLGMDTHFIWEDEEPVSQAVYGRNTPNGGVVNWVYTPPQYRGQGYATSVVAELSKAIFDRGKKFCCLYADAANPISRGVYSKLGYYDVCTFDEIKFDSQR